ncbi:MAG: hypothetical protein IKZ34_02355 [Alphaproteobacteria bacterium]|nr:hypothetical protein [Alphaproteobacteria bacterium]
MKGLKLLFAVLLVPLAFQAAFANDDVDTSRAATRRGTTNTVLSNRQKPSSSEPKSTVNSHSPTSRTVNISKPEQQQTSRERTTTTKSANNRGSNVVSRTGTNQTNKSVSARTASSVQLRTQPASTSRVMNRNSTPVQQTRSRSGIVSRSASNTTATKSRTQSRSAMIARSGTTGAITASAIQSRNYSSCRDIFYECMDEFCANKDSSLKRCACSSRVHDFDKTKKQLSVVEDKLLDFSQRLLTVNLDKEDALAINSATEGETAYAIKDTSKSKKMLDEISKKLNSSFNNKSFDQNLNTISLSLNADAAFDSVDSMQGASTTTKTGTELYNAALPICREMALEICSESDLNIAESGYQMSIAQDCNTVEKSYESQNEQARAKIKESSALLDMSRLNIHQERNSDDMLSCKKKMLDMLTDTTVCGKDMVKCLDISGQYIDPTTGEAILNTTLADLGNLITRPGPNETWTKTPGNKNFILFLESKKVYLEETMSSCQDISEYVWDAFIEDALSQIKLAQEAKLEQVRQSCTTLTSQCLDNAYKTITEFDARALSIFGIKADITVNAMCSDIKDTCTALMNAIDSRADGSNDWTEGITEITAEKTYSTLLSTCREVGKNCIIQACSDISGNFGLCENINTSINRKAIVSRRSCWAEVEQCIRDAGSESIAQIMKQHNRVATQFSGDKYGELYGIDRAETATVSNIAPGVIELNNGSSIYDWCNADYGAGNISEFDWQVCRLTEQIWGNCENVPGLELDSDSTNRIILNFNYETGADNSNETLLSWFARNTNTSDATDSCRDTTCGYGFTEHNGACINKTEFTSDGEYCPSNSTEYTIINIKPNTTNCCHGQYDTNATVITDDKGKNICCVDGTVGTVTTNEHYSTSNTTSTSTSSICKPSETVNDNKTELFLSTDSKDYYCTGGTINISGETVNCTGGVWTTVSRSTKNSTTLYETPTATNTSNSFYYETNSSTLGIPAENSGAMIGTPNRNTTGS